MLGLSFLVDSSRSWFKPTMRCLRYTCFIVMKERQEKACEGRAWEFWIKCIVKNVVRVAFILKSCALHISIFIFPGFILSKGNSMETYILRQSIIYEMYSVLNINWRLQRIVNQKTGKCLAVYVVCTIASLKIYFGHMIFCIETLTL